MTDQPNDGQHHNEALFHQALALHRQGRLTAARELYHQVVAAVPHHARAWHLLGIIALQAQRPEDALGLLGRTLALEPRNAAAHNDHGNAEFRLARYAAALDSFEQAVALQPREAEYHNNRANALYELGRHDAAIASYDAAIARDATFAGGHYNRAMVLHDLRRFEEAVASFDRAIALNPGHARAHNHRGNSLFEMGRMSAALASYAAATAIKSDYADAHFNQGNALFELERYAEALASYDRALALAPGHSESHSNRGNALYQLDRIEEALAAYAAAIGLKANYPGVHFNRGQLQDELRRHEEALSSYDAALALDPAFKCALGNRLLSRMHVCDWRNHAAEHAELCARIARDEPAAHPFSVLALSGSAPLQRQAARIWVREQAPPNHRLPLPAGRAAGGKIRIGYFSADFCEHPVSTLSAGLFEAHDRTHFTVTAFSLGPDVRDAMRRRLEHAFDEFIDVHQRPALDIAMLARERAIDIAVDLTGLTRRCRPAIFAARAAPIQVSYLGYPGTMSAPYMDYLIADRMVVPPALRPYYAEKLLYLPSYQANDSRRQLPVGRPTRQDLGLPASAFVFCCFSASHKIMPAQFDSWMRILGRAPHAVLWLYAAHESVRRNLCQEAAARHIDAGRLVFGGSLPVADYLARYTVADLFLDTLPYNGGATASDALWVGLPVLTCAGDSFAGRMAASLLTAVGLPELIASNSAEYEDLAVALAGDPSRVADLKLRLAANRLGARLFDTARHTRTLEAGYRRMHERQVSGLAPADIVVE